MSTSRLAKFRTTIILFLLYAILAGIVVPYVGQDLPYSVFYASSSERDHKRLLLENDIRLERARNVLHDLDCTGDCWRGVNRVNVEPEFCFVVISVSRPELTYFLTQVVANLVHQIPHGKSVFSVYNAEGRTHQEVRNLSSIVPVFTSTKESKQFSRFVKEKDDYVEALEWCHDRNAKFSVVLEDDALPSQDFVERIMFILNYRMAKTSTKWIYLKLFYPEKWQGWSNETDILAELFLVTIVGGLILVAVVYCIEVLLSLATRAGCCENALRYFLSAVFVLYTLLCIGRPHWMAIRQLSPHFSSVVVAPDCCTPAVLFPRTHLSDLIRRLKAKSCSASYHLDTALDDIAVEKGLLSYLATPNLVSHIGFVSSLGKGWKNPREFQHIL